MTLFGTVIPIQKWCICKPFNALGCDSTHTLNLTINNTDSHLAVLLLVMNLFGTVIAIQKLVHIQPMKMH